MALRRFITNSFANGSLTMNKFANDAFYFVGIVNIYHANSTYGAVAGLPAFNIPNSGSFAVIQGRNFSNTVTVLIDGTAAPAVSVVNNSTVNIQTPVKTNGAYDVYVINSDGTFALRPAGITFVDYPTWVTNTSLPSTIYGSNSYSTQLVATGGTITYNLTNGSSLPNWLSLSSNGLLSSTSTPPNDNEESFVFSVDAYTPSSNIRFSREFTIFSSNNNIEMMLVAGGGAGHSQGGGGGGGGMLLYTSNTAVSLKTPNGNSFTLSVNSALVVNIGSGGVYSGTTATRGGNTTVVGGGINYSAFGGGSGASRDYASPNVAGGSGGGGGSGAAGGSNAGGAGTAGQGFNGADGTNSTSGGGGGGGASQAGSSGGNYLGKGGDGHAISLEGTSIYYAGGGGAGGTGGFAGGGGVGGLGGGGGGPHGIVGGGGSAAGTLSSNADPGTYGQGRVNSGGGGGSSYNGGSGVVVMRHSRQYPPANVTGGAFTSNTDNYFRWYNITANCTITFYNFGQPVWDANTSLPSALKGNTYSHSLAANGSSTHTLESGTLPTWLTLHSNGLLQSSLVELQSDPNFDLYTFTVRATWTANNRFTLLRSFTLYAVSAPPTIDYLVVAGGGGGTSGGGAGGGAGGFVQANSVSITQPSTFTAVVGAGGAAGNFPDAGPGVQGGNGANSTLSGANLSLITAIGGGGAGYYTPSQGITAGSNGGSGGGSPSAGTNQGRAGGVGVYPGSTYINAARQGYNGGSNLGRDSGGAGGGGGGGGEAGVSATTIAWPSNGGIGIISSISGSSTYYCGGGGSRGSNSAGFSVSGLGGLGGGGRWNYSVITGGAAQHGADNTGGGGGGGGGAVSLPGGNGGSGIVIISYPSSYSPVPVVSGNVSVTISGGNRIYSFYSSGSIRF